MSSNRPDSQGTGTKSGLCGTNNESLSERGSETDSSSCSSNRSTDSKGRNRLPRTRKSTLAGWYLEMICCVISAGCVYSIVEILLIYNHKPSPQFPLGVTLNSIVALLSSICSMACTFVAAEGVSQMKWNHYALGKSRPLSDLQAFDNASRGVWGSFKILFIVDSIRSLSLLLVVFFVMITGILSPSITQSAITNTDMTSNEGTADSSPLSLSIQETSELRTAVQLGLVTPYYTAIPPVTPVCPTGNCEFPIFTTLAVCSDVRNATHLLKFSEVDAANHQEAQRLLDPVPIFDSSSRNDSQRYNWPYARKASLPVGSYLIGGPAYFSLNISYSTASETLPRAFPWNQTGSMLPTLLFDDERDLLKAGIIYFFVIWVNQAYFENKYFPNTIPSDYLDSAFRASEVLVHFCLKDVNVSVSNGKPQTTLSDTPSIYTSKSDEINESTAPYYYLNIGTEQDGDSQLYVGEESFVSLFYYLRRKLRGTVGFTRTPNGTVRDQTSSSEIIGDALWPGPLRYTRGSPGEPRQVDKICQEEYSSIASQDEQQALRLQNTIQNLADSLTNMIRQGGGNGRNRKITGTTLHHGITRIRWEYLTLPGLQVGMSILFLACIIRQTVVLKVELYKSELLPVLLAINPADRSQLLNPTEKPVQSQDPVEVSNQADCDQQLELHSPPSGPGTEPASCGSESSSTNSTYTPIIRTRECGAFNSPMDIC